MMLEPIRHECQPPAAPRTCRAGLRIVLSTLGPDAGAIGAARAAILQRHDPARGRDSSCPTVCCPAAA